MKAQRGSLGFQSHTAGHRLHNNPELSCITRHSRRAQQGRPLRVERLCVSLGKLMGVTIQLTVQEEKKNFIFKMFSYVYEEK